MAANLIEQMHARIRARVDTAFLERAPEVLARLDRTGIQSLHDLKDALLIARNMLVPAAMVQEVGRLEALRASVHAQAASQHQAEGQSPSPDSDAAQSPTGAHDFTGK